jgi:hypothetical protein
MLVSCMSVGKLYVCGNNLLYTLQMKNVLHAMMIVVS